MLQPPGTIEKEVVAQSVHL